MSDKDTHFELIEAYLEGTLSPAESKAFEARLSQEPDLAASLALQRDTRALLQLDLQQHYKAQLQTIDAEHDAQKIRPLSRPLWARPVFRVAAVVLLLLASAYLWIWVQYDNQSLVENAFVAYEDILGARGNSSAEAALARAMQAYNQKEYAAAIPAFEAVLAEDPEQADARFYLGIAQLAQGNAQAAEKLLGPAAERGRYRAPARWYVTLAYLAQGKTELGLSRLRELAREADSFYAPKAQDLLDQWNSPLRALPGVK